MFFVTHVLKFKYPVRETVNGGIAEIKWPAI